MAGQRKVLIGLKEIMEFFKNQEITLLNNNKPVIHPKAKIIRTKTSFSLTALRINSYFPKISNKKLPEIPGSIMAQMAMAPAAKVNQMLFGEEIIGSSVIK